MPYAGAAPLSCTPESCGGIPYAASGASGRTSALLTSEVDTSLVLTSEVAASVLATSVVATSVVTTSDPVASLPVTSAGMPYAGVGAGAHADNASTPATSAP